MRTPSSAADIPALEKGNRFLCRGRQAPLRIVKTHRFTPPRKKHARGAFVPKRTLFLPRFPAAFQTCAGKPCTAYAMPHRRRVRIVRRGRGACNTRAGLFLRPETDASLPRFPAAFQTCAGKPYKARAMPHRRRVRIVRRGSDFQHTRGASASRIAAREKSLHSPRVFVRLTSCFAVQAVPPRSSAATKYPQAAPPNRRRASRPAP